MVRRYEKYLPYLLVMPALVALFLVTMYPFIYAIYLSLYNLDFLAPRRLSFVGAKNYLDLLKDGRFLNSVKVTAIYVISAVGIEITLGILLAHLLRGKIKGATIFRAIFTLPAVICPVVVALSWKIMLHGTIGVINYMINKLTGITPPAWLSMPSTALTAVILVDVWQWAPFMLLVFTAALDSLPQEPFEAAKVDGASALQTLLHVSLPMLRPIIGIMGIIRVVDALRTFDKIFILTRGGPGISTETVDLYAYYVGLAEGGRISYAAAIAVLMTFLTEAIALIYLKLMMRGVKV